MPQDDRARVLGETEHNFRARKVLPGRQHADINACPYPNGDGSVCALRDLECEARCTDMRGRCDVIFLCVGRSCKRRFSTRQEMLRMNDLGWLFPVDDTSGRSGAPQLIVNSMYDGRCDRLLC